MPQDFSAAQIYRRILDNIEHHIQGQTQAIRKLLAAFVAGGHVLLEDLPGTGKTTVAKALAASLNADFRRIQFTPDLLPSDILGVSIFNQQAQEFRFHKGPVFTEILLADEINRASPRAQSALLEAMEERQVSLDGVCYPLSDLFFVIATQNPVEFHGTYPLPEAQMDRFALRSGLGYVAAEEEVKILSQRRGGIPASLQPCVSREEIIELKKRVASVRVSDELIRYIVDIARATRETPGIALGASLRAGMSLLKMAQALALFDGMEFITPAHIQEIAVAVIAHRLKADSQAQFSGYSTEQAVQDILARIPAPV